MLYNCYNSNAKRKSEKTWVGEICNLIIKKSYYEMDVAGRGSSFHIIFGDSQKGGYICIPEWDVGSQLASYEDTFWNTEQLVKQLSIVDAITVATAIKTAATLIRKTVV